MGLVLTQDDRVKLQAAKFLTIIFVIIIFAPTAFNTLTETYAKLTEQALPSTQAEQSIPMLPFYERHAPRLLQLDLRAEEQKNQEFPN